jgi:hypothetical protein
MSNAVVNVLSGFNGQLGLVNTGTGTAQGVASTVESQFAMAGKSYGPVQAFIGLWGVLNVGEKVYDNYQTTGTFSITGAQAANLAGNLASMGMGIYKSNPWGLAAGVGITVIEYGFNLTTKSQQPTASNPNNPNYGNQGLGTPLQASLLPFNYRGAGFNDPRLSAVPPTLAARSDTASAYSASTPAEINAQAQARLLRQEGVGSAGGSSVSSQAIADANNSSDPIGSLISSQGWTGSSGSSESGGDSSASYGGSTGSNAGTDNPNAYSSSGSSGSVGYDAGYGYGMGFPIIIDLDGDGVEIKPLSRSATYFDFDDDGFKERTAWAGADDGLLVIDLDGDGQITQSKEIALAQWTPEQDTDLQALAKVFDSNQDGTFDARDARFNGFRIWKAIAANESYDRRCA